MSFAMFVTWVLVGVLAGVLAGLVMKRGGYGLKNDVILGLAGSIGASWSFRATDVFPSAGILTMVFVAAIGDGPRDRRATQVSDHGASG